MTDYNKVVQALNLYDETPAGFIEDADTILEDIVSNADLHEVGIGQDLLKIWLNADKSGRTAVEDTFLNLTGVEFPDYVERCVKETTRPASPDETLTLAEKTLDDGDIVATIVNVVNGSLAGRSFVRLFHAGTAISLAAPSSDGRLVVEIAEPDNSSPHGLKTLYRKPDCVNPAMQKELANLGDLIIALKNEGLEMAPEFYGGIGIKPPQMTKAECLLRYEGGEMSITNVELADLGKSVMVCTITEVVEFCRRWYSRRQ